MRNKFLSSMLVIGVLLGLRAEANFIGRFLNFVSKSHYFIAPAVISKTSDLIKNGTAKFLKERWHPSDREYYNSALIPDGMLKELRKFKSGYGDFFRADCRMRGGVVSATMLSGRGGSATYIFCLIGTEAESKDFYTYPDKYVLRALETNNWYIMEY